MIITKNKHIKTISELTVMHQTQLAEINEIIEDQEKQIESIVDRLSNKLKEIGNAKRGANETLELLDYSSEDSVIPSIVNFLNEQGNTEAARIIGKCKLGKVSIKQWEFGNDVHIPIFCTGDAYNGLSDKYKDETEQIKKAFITFYSKYYIHNSTNMKYNRSTSADRWIYYLDLTMKHIEPKESDLEQFFEKVKKLKKLISKK